MVSSNINHSIQNVSDQNGAIIPKGIVHFSLSVSGLLLYRDVQRHNVGVPDLFIYSEAALCQEVFD